MTAARPKLAEIADGRCDGCGYVLPKCDCAVRAQVARLARIARKEGAQ